MTDRSLDLRLNRFPMKQGWDLLSLGQIALSRRYGAGAKARCLAFYFTAGGIRNLYATLPRSGTHWSLLGIALARDLAQGGEGNYDFVVDAWVARAGAVHTKLDWREPAGAWDSETDPAVIPISETRRMSVERRPGVLARPLLFHTHLPYYRLRYAGLASMRTAITLRSIYDSMESKYHKHQVLLGMGVRPTEYAGGPTEPPSEANEFHFPWDQQLDDDIEFYNSWGDALARHANTTLFRYEDLLTEPAHAHKALTDFWGLNVPYECLAEAFRRLSKEEMKKKLPAGSTDTTSRVTFRTPGAALTEARIAFIRERLERRLVHDFGYGFEWRKQKVAA